MAKRIIAEKKTLALPPAGPSHLFMADTTLWFRLDVPHDPFFDTPFLVPHHQARFSAVQVEQQISKNNATIIPDLIVTDADSGEVILLEILVTHAVDEIKRSKITELGFSCVEIDLRPFLRNWRNRVVSLEAFPDWLIQEVETKRWIYCRALETCLAERREAVQRAHTKILADLERTRNISWHRVPYEEVLWDEASSAWILGRSTINPARPFADQRKHPVRWRIDLNIRFSDLELRQIATKHGARWDPRRKTWYYIDAGGVISYNDQYYFSSIPVRLRDCAKQETWTRLPEFSEV